MKEYFSHDYEARNDPKCSALIKDLGLEGYGLYWCLVEIFHIQNGKIKKFPKLFDGLSYQLGIEKDNLTKQFEAMLKDYNLFQEDENYIWSERILRNIKEREEKYKVKAEAGRLGGIKSGIRRQTKQNEALLEAKRSKTKQNELKERKVNVNKSNVNVKEINVKEEKSTSLAKVKTFAGGGGDIDISTKPEKPYELKTDLQKVVCAYKLLKGFKKEDGDWDKLNYARCSKSAKQLLEYFKQDGRKVVNCMQDIANELEKKGLEYTFETLVRHSSDWQLKNEKEEKNV